MKQHDRWYSQRLYSDVNVVRWGHYGQPVIVFPTAGGDAEEIERMHLVDAVGAQLEAGRVKLYSCDSVAGAAMLRGDGSAGYRAALLNAFHEFVRNEMIPAIRLDCHSDQIPVVAAGASIGAFNALALLCRYPDVVAAAIGMSGTYDVGRFVGDGGGEDLYFATPLYFVPGLQGEHLTLLRSRFAVLASGEGRWENIGESWRMADVLGGQGVPNRVDPWGPQYDHDWQTWREMLPTYLEQLT
ncbi:MAG: esterase family protein [Candidatus Dormibacteria bacterium]